MTALRVPFLLAIALSVSTAQGAPLFRAPVPMDGAFAFTRELVKADFNGDGFPDVAGLQGGTITVALNDGAGPFAAPSIITLPWTGQRIASGDLNNDGDPDLVYDGGATLGVLLGNGDGTFNAGPAGPATDFGPLGLGDVNADGKLDLVMASTNIPPGASSPTLQWYFGNGSGGFGAASTLPLSSAVTPVYRIAVADLNADGRADVIVGHGTNDVYLSTGSSLQYTAGYPEGAVTVGRLNADAIPDFVLLAYPDLHFYLGNGNGTFTLNGSQFSTGTKTAIADMDGDSITDVVAVGSGLSVSLGAGNGSFAEPLLTAGTADTFVIGDFDRDGENDLASPYSFFRGNGDGTFREDRTYLTRPGWEVESTGVSALDMNGDGHPDATTLLSTWEGTTDIAVRPNDGSGGLSPAVYTATTNLGEPEAFLVGRLNADAHPDALVIATLSGVTTAHTFIGNGNATFTAGAARAVSSTMSFTIRPKLADITGDGALDLLIGSDIYEGNGDGSFDAPRSVGATFVLVGDIDGNGTLDAIWSSGNQLAVARNSGGGTFGAPVLFGAQAGGLELLADLDEDGALDILTISGMNTRVYRGHGDGTFHEPLAMAHSGTSWSVKEALVDDFDGDGAPDVAFGAFVLLGDGEGRFRGMESSWFYADSAVADFDGSGGPDLLTVSEGTFSVNLTRLAPAPTRNSAITVAPLLPPEHATPADFRAMVTGVRQPVTGYVLYSVGDVPVAIGETLRENSVAPQTRAIASVSLTLPAGTHELTATFLGNETHLPSSTSTSVTVDRASTSLEVQPLYDWIYGTTAELQWTLTAKTNAAMPAPSLAFTITEGGQPLSDVQLFADHALIRGLAAGIHTLTVQFDGDTNYEPASAVIQVSVAKRNPQMLHEILPQASARLAGPVTLIAKFAALEYGSITGTVAFTLNGTAAGTHPVSANRAEHTETLEAGKYTVKLQYSGDANNQAAELMQAMWVYAPAGTVPAVKAEMNGTSAQLSWVAPAGAASFVIYQRLLYTSDWAVIKVAFIPETSVPISTGTRMFAVAARYQDNSLGPIGPPDITTRLPFAEEPVGNGTLIRTTQIDGLRAAVQYVRTFAGLPSFAYTDASLAPGAPIRALHFTELRTALTQARNAIGLPLAFSPAPAVGGLVRSTHVEELRAGVR